MFIKLHTLVTIIPFGAVRNIAITNFLLTVALEMLTWPLNTKIELSRLVYQDISGCEG